ncbi:unannotated protein [freshwater metagenome]|uniref:Unannotated protein n=1 Tax=freshwater metagenome TaxID=449393 RepID=A0A6J6QLN5_9ZZZZ
MTLRNDPGTEVRRDLSLGAPYEWDPACLEVGRDPVDSGTGGTEGFHLRSVLDHPHRANHVDSATERGRRHEREEIDEETGPSLVADCSDARTTRKR